YREYYADIDDPFIEGFYIEFDPEEEEFYIGFTVTPPDSNKREFKKALETACAKQGIDADEYGCFSTYEEFSYQSFLATDIDIMTDAAFQMYAKIKKIRQSLE
ncbi:hypothetical protein LJC09_03570, partial [Desulfovibrio sp. OttesenSCG-928-F20]|nr:hypothetical protein [Desulfovibrio sp. OttesenSCG-928-F20]